MSNGLMAASGYAGLENSPLARIGYYDKIISKGWERDYLGVITNTEIDGRITGCNQVVQFMKQPNSGPWRRGYEKNQELVPDQITPEGFCMVICESAWKAVKFDKLDVQRICERWAPFEQAFLDDTYNTLAEQWRQYVLTGMALEASARNKGAAAGRSGNINLGTTGAPITITGPNVGRELAKIKRVLKESRRWVEGEMFIVLPPAIVEQFVESPYANALNMGNCVDCSLLVTGELPTTVMGFTVIESDLVESVIDPVTTTETYKVVAGHRSAFAFAGDLVEGEIARVPNSFGFQYQMLAVWGSKAIYPDALAVGYWTV